MIPNGLQNFGGIINEEKFIIMFITCIGCNYGRM